MCGTTHRAKQTARSPWSATDHHTGTRCPCLTSSILGIQQQQWWVKKQFTLGFTPRSSKQTMQWRITFHERTHTRTRKNGTDNSGNPALPLLKHTALCRWKILLPLTDDKKRERRLWSECQWQMYLQQLVGCSYAMGTLFEVSQNSHLTTPFTNIVRYSQKCRAGLLITWDNKVH